jgi:hypothetical protein
MNKHFGAFAVADKAYTDALARRKELLAELAVIEDFIRAYERMRGLRSSVPLAGAPGESPRRHRERNIVPPAEIAEIAREIILERGEPMTRSELADSIESRGIPLAGKDKAKNVGTILWRFQDQFLNVQGRGYWPKDVPNPELDYHPQQGE